MGQLLNIVQEVWIKGRIAHEVHLFCPVLLKLGTPQGQTNGRCVMAIAGTRMPDCIETHIPHPSLQPQGIQRPTLPCCRAFWLFSGTLNTPSVSLCVPLFLPKGVHPKARLLAQRICTSFTVMAPARQLCTEYPGQSSISLYLIILYIYIPLHLSSFSPSLASTLSDR